MATDNPVLEPEAIFYPEPEGAQAPGDDVEVDPTIGDESNSAAADTDDAVEEDADKSVSDVDDAGTYVEIDGREITVEQIKEWENGHLRQSDYTKKTQGVSDRVKQEVEAISKEKHQSLDDSITELSALIDHANDNIDWDDLKSYDQDEYIKQTELKATREQALANAKSLKNSDRASKKQAADDAEKELLLEEHPEFLDSEGNTSDAYRVSMKQVEEYFKSNSWSAQEQAKLTTAKSWSAVIKAAAALANQKKASKAKKKIKALPLVNKSAKSSVKTPRSPEEIFYGEN